jgi:hypothetical protein
LSPERQEAVNEAGRKVLVTGLAWRTCEKRRARTLAEQDARRDAVKVLVQAHRAALDDFQRLADREGPPGRLVPGGEA